MWSCVIHPLGKDRVSKSTTLLTPYIQNDIYFSIHLYIWIYLCVYIYTLYFSVTDKRGSDQVEFDSRSKEKEDMESRIPLSTRTTWPINKSQFQTPNTSTRTGSEMDLTSQTVHVSEFQTAISLGTRSDHGTGRQVCATTRRVKLSEVEEYDYGVPTTKVKKK